MDQLRFLNTLFDKDDQVCLARAPFEILVNKLPLEHIEANYVSINALQHTRADQNVTKYRTFLLEFDNMPLEDQIPYVKASGLPYTAIVFSGNKSYHFFVTLEEKLSPKEYECVAKRLHLLLPEADKSTKNPSRLARIPEVYRPDTRKLQNLVELRGRVTLAELLLLLPELPQRPASEPKSHTSIFQRSALIEARREPDKVMKMLGISGRNNFLFWVGARLSEDGMTNDFKVNYVTELYNNLEDTSGFSLDEAYSAARVK